MPDKKQNTNNNNSEREILIDEKKGIAISYPKNQIEKTLPHLYEELTKKGYNIEISGYKHFIEDEDGSDDLISPGPVSFIRRCSNNEEAIEILDYLLSREEITKIQYDALKNKLLKDGLNSFGERKTWGYYERKYRNSE